MLEAYLDESGIHGGASVCVVAGYWGRRNQWGLLESQWRGTLSAFGCSLEDFHAKDMVKKARYRPMLEALSGTIAKYQVYPVSMGIVVPDFNSLTLQERKFFTGATIRNGKLIGTGSPTKPYFVPFQLCLMNITDYAKPGEKAHFFFGLDRPFAEYARAMFARIKTDGKHSKAWESKRRLGDPSFPMAKETPELQAADLLAHLTYQHMTERYAANNFMVAPKGLLAICLKNTRKKKNHNYQNLECLELTLEKTYQISGSKWDTERIELARARLSMPSV
jgi:hypothetical protein